MHITKGLLLLALLLTFGFSSGCGTLYYYSTKVQETKDQAALQKAPVYYVKHISFDQIPKPEDYESEQQWREEIDHLMPEYEEEVSAWAKEANLVGKVIPLKKDQKADKGVLVEAEVKNIRREWSGFSGGFDYLTSDIRFTDVQSGEVLFTAEVETTSLRYGPIGWRANAFSGRLAFNTWNVVRAIFSAIQNGKIDPLQY